jgi:23S rRNA maturation mini-RNase III
MKKRAPASPLDMARLTAASWETIFRRTVMMAQGTCSAAEYHRMTAEKVAAMQASTLALMTGRGSAAIMAPFLSRSRANARRLRRKS